PPPLAVGEPPETPFSTKKVKTAGGSQKCKGFFWWGACGLARTGGVAGLLALLLASLTLGTRLVPQIVGWLPQG
ncbi:MAG: hypothetical protein WBC12_00670, partial [Candidatus Saccharimonas aalborgensis]